MGLLYQGSVPYIFFEGQAELILEYLQSSKVRETLLQLFKLENRKVSLQSTYITRDQHNIFEI